MVWMDHILSIHPSGDMGRLHLLAVVNSDAVNMQISLQDTALTTFGDTPTSEALMRTICTKPTVFCVRWTENQGELGVSVLRKQRGWDATPAARHAS